MDSLEAEPSRNKANAAGISELLTQLDAVVLPPVPSAKRHEKRHSILSELTPISAENEGEDTARMARD